MSRRGRLLAIGVPSGALLVIAALSFAEEERGRSSLEVCRHRSADGGLSRKADLAAPERERRGIEKSLRASLALLQGKTSAPKDPSHDAGLSGCTRNRELEIILAQPLPSVFRDRPLYFVRLGKGGKPPRGLPASFEKNALVFALAYSSLADARDLARATGARVSIGTAELAEKFGVRCAESRVRVSGDGKTLRIEEIMP